MRGTHAHVPASTAAVALWCGCRWGQAAINAPFTPFVSVPNGPWAALVSTYQWQLWRPEKLGSSAKVPVPVHPGDPVKRQPLDAVKGILHVANEQVRQVPFLRPDGCAFRAARAAGFAAWRPWVAARPS